MTYVILENVHVNKFVFFTIIKMYTVLFCKFIHKIGEFLI